MDNKPAEKEVFNVDMGAKEPTPKALNISVPEPKAPKKKAPPLEALLETNPSKLTPAEAVKVIKHLKTKINTMETKQAMLEASAKNAIQEKVKMVNMVDEAEKHFEHTLTDIKEITNHFVKGLSRII